MGQVYRARDLVLDRDVAVKILRGDDAAVYARAQREARHQARVDHENVGHIYEVGKLAGKPFVAMQLIEGRDLGTVMTELSLVEKVDVLRQVADGVQAAHSRGLIHRDIKPGNILVERRDSGWHPWVVDFGLAVDPSQPGLSATGDLVGTATYMSPEQIRGERSGLDRRSDIYALGATLFEVLTGRGPFVGDHPVQVLTQALHDDAPRLRSLVGDLPFELELIVGKCLEKDPERRYSSARLLADDLERYLRGEPVLARAPSWSYRWKKKLARHRTMAAIVVVAAVLVAGALAVALRARWQAARTARYAQEFGREAEQVATRLRIAQLTPQHDLAEEMRSLVGQTEQLELRARQLGGAALQPGLLAVARARLALGQLEEARQRLDEAWNVGERDPELARLRGRLLAQLHRRRLASIRRLDPRWRDIELARERELLVGPALAAFAQVDNLDHRDRTHLALLEEDLEAAMTSAQAAVAAAPWDHEPKLLLADVLAESAHQAFEVGESQRAVELLSAARGVLEEARAIGRSDPQVYRQECSLAELRFEVALVGSLPATTDPGHFLDPCDLAVATDSSSASSLARRSGLRRHLASRAMRQGADPLEHIEESIVDGEKALELEPRLTDALYQTGVAYSLRANHAAETADEISMDLARAGELLERCVLEAPKFVPCRVSLGVNHLETGIHFDNEGHEASDSFRGAIAAFEEAITLAPTVAVLRNNLGYTMAYQAEVELSQGIDPRSLLAEARSVLDRAIDLAPDYASARLSLGESHRIEARYLRGQALDPSSAVARAVAAYAEALRLDPDRYYAALSSFEVQRIQVDHRQQLGLDSAESLESLRAVLAEAERISGEPLPCERAEVRIREGVLAGSAAAWREAQDLAHRSDCPLTEARAWSRLAAWQAEQRHDPTEAIRGGLEALVRYQAEAGGDAEAEALRAALEFGIARASLNPDLARAAADRSVTAWERALELHPVAGPRWAASIDELQRWRESMPKSSGGPPGEPN